MGDQEAGAALQQAEGGLLEPLLRGSIHTAGGLVQDEDRRCLLYTSDAADE